MTLSDELSKGFKVHPVSSFVCKSCGSLVPSEYRETHSSWHKSLKQTAKQASYADMVSRPIG